MTFVSSRLGFSTDMDFHFRKFCPDKLCLNRKDYSSISNLYFLFWKIRSKYFMLEFIRYPFVAKQVEQFF